ncbi:EAL domain-containing protein [Legionella cardiaca]|uniref:EAL domain-containing protein n=1 Tax=Legionella cardiaca TaxID=1071983 RepID=A0ABY8AS50_9GAMM|nr:EAL domain-containing protein [Legionella cardiaca]WED43289.1 EAL domain-containing protein [Legionella cardiaca]
MKDDKILAIITQLRRTLSKMELSLGVIDDAIIWTNNHGIIMWCNEQFSHLIKRPHIAILGNAIDELIQLRQANNVISFKDYLSLQGRHDFNIYNLLRDGNPIFLEVYLRQFQSLDEEISLIIIMREITEKQKSQEKIKFLASIPENNAAPIFSVSYNKELLFINEAANALFEFWEKTCGHRIPPNVLTAINLAIKEQKEQLIEETCLENEYLFSITPGSLHYVNVYGTNITSRKKAEKELLYLSSHDILTNLYNRSAFEKTLNKTITRSRQNHEQFAILLLDLDNFKQVNDTFGHHVGDQLLVTVAKHLRENIRANDIVARLGGDEFVILLSNIKTEQEVDKFAKSLIRRFNKPIELENHCFLATVSAGIVIAPKSGKDASTLLKNADMALYTVKELGRNNYQFFTNTIHNNFSRRSEIEMSLIDAMRKEEFYLVYQPQYKLPRKQIIGMEVLLRWQHPTLGAVMPAEFIPITEKNGLILQLGEWVLRSACKQYMSWQDQGIIARNINLAINLSPKQLEDKNFLNSMKNILQETNMSAKNLELELTETAVMTSAVDLDDSLKQLKSMGIKLSIDDFGTGYSSLTRLKDLPVNSLKIDKSFIRDLATDSDHATIVKSIIGLGNSLGLNVITEGVETEEQLNLLFQYQCTMAQGFYFEKQPLTVDEMSRLLQQNF